MENLKRIEVLDNVVNYMRENNLHVETEAKTGGVLLVSKNRLNWIPFSAKARECTKRERKSLVVAVYENEQGEKFLLVSRPGELRSSYKEDKNWF